MFFLNIGMFWCKNVSLYHISPPKSQKHFFVTHKSLRVLFRVLSYGFLFRIVSDRVLFRALSDTVLFRFLSDRVFFRFLSDSFLFESSVLGSSSRFSVIDSSLGSSDLFSGMPLFFIKTLHYILKKTFTLNS